MKYKDFIFNLIEKLYKSRFSKDVAYNSIILWLAKSIGFVIPVIVGRYLGISWQTDTFFLMFAFLMFFTLTVSATLEAVLVPFLVGEIDDNKRNLISYLLIWTAIIITTLAAIGYFLFSVFTNIQTRFDELQINLFKELFIISLPIVYANVFSSIFSAVVISDKMFVQSSLSGVVRSVIIIIILFTCINSLGVYAVPVSLTIGEITKMFYLYFYIKTKSDFRFKITIAINEQFKQFLRVGGFQFLSVAIVGFNPIIDKAIASQLVVGSVSIIEYSEKIYLIPVTLLSLGVTMVILPRWSEKINQNQFRTVWREIKISSFFMIIISSIVVLPIIFFSADFIKILFGTNITEENLALISLNTVYYLIGVPFYVFSLILLRALIAAKMTKEIMRISLVRLILNIILDIVLIQYFGIFGITIATTLNSMILAVMLFFAVKILYIQRNNKIELR